MLEIAPRGKHYAFEPIPYLAANLRRLCPTVSVHACALSDTEEVATFAHVVNVPGWSGLRRGDYPDQVEVEQITVDVRRLDDVIPADTAVRFIKIDVEGAELQVLRGGVNTIRRCRPHIVFEFGEGHARPYGTTPEMIWDYLTSQCGLGVFSLIGRRSRLGRERFRAVCRAATNSNYAWWAQGNFLARPD
jgi:FkbM family methyltransferase